MPEYGISSKSFRCFIGLSGLTSSKTCEQVCPLHLMSCSRPLSHVSKGNGLEQQLLQGLKTSYHTEGTRKLRSPS